MQWRHGNEVLQSNLGPVVSESSPGGVKLIQQLEGN